MRLLALLSSLALAVLFVPTPGLVGHADAGSAAIQPGDRITTSVGTCTLSFLFEGTGSQAGNLYFSTADHCVRNVGDRVRTTTYGAFGTVAFLGGGGFEDDYAFIRVDADKESRVSPVVRGHDAPTGYTTRSETLIGDVVEHSGYGVGFDISGPSRERRVGVLYGDTPRLYTTESPIIFGDSGGPILHMETGKALGIVSNINVGCCGIEPPVRNQGPTVQGMISDAASRGFTVDLVV